MWQNSQPLDGEQEPEPSAEELKDLEQGKHEHACMKCREKFECFDKDCAPYLPLACEVCSLSEN